MKKLFLVLALLILGLFMSQGAFAECNSDTDRFDTIGWCIDHYGQLTPKSIVTDSQQIATQGSFEQPVVYIAGAFSTYDTLSTQNSGQLIVDMGGATPLVSLHAEGGEYILPTAAPNLTYSFAVGTQNVITIDTLTNTDLILLNGNPIGDGIKNTSQATADSITVTSPVAGLWVVSDKVGTWATTGATRVH